MSMKRLMAALPLAMLAACSSVKLDVPRADNYAASSQQKARAVHHWDVLAQDVASRIADKLQGQPEAAQAVYLVADGNVAFSKGFRSLLLTRLLDKGVKLSTSPTSLQLKVETQVVQHHSAASNRPLFPLTTLAAGIAVARDLVLHASAGTAAAVGVGAVAALEGGDLLLNGTASGGPTRTEVLVSTSLEQGSIYLARTSDLYYIDLEDSALYDAPQSSRNWKVVGQ